MNVLIVSPDRLLVRQLSKFLAKFGYLVRETAELEAGLAALRVERPDFLIFNTPLAQGGKQLCEEAGRCDRNALYTVFLLESAADQELVHALAAGVDDFLSQPIVYGELLARLRAGARALEAERRFRTSRPRTGESGFPMREACVAQFNGGGGSAGRREPAACVVLDIDGLGLINGLHGVPVGDAARDETVRRLKTQLCEGDAAADFGNGRYGVFTTHSMAEATAWAERMRQTLADSPLVLGELQLHLTASFGVAPCSGGSEDDLCEAAELAEEALTSARHSGRNCVMCSGDCERDTKSWSGLASPAKMFASTQARHVMFPCTVVVKGGEPIEHAQALFAQTGLPYLPVVDDGGRYVGFLSGEKAQTSAGCSAKDAVMGDVPSYEPDAPFVSLMDRFMQGDESLLAVVQNKRAVGYVLRQGLAALVHPVERENYASAHKPATARDLVVPLLPAARA